MKTLLFIDDKRNPFLPSTEPFLPPSSSDLKIIWVRSYNELLEYLQNNPLPDIISFDHDLHEQHYVPQFFWDNYELSRDYQEYMYPKYIEPTGYHCALLFVEFSKKSDKEVSLFVHSMNEYGRNKILGALQSAGF